LLYWIIITQSGSIRLTLWDRALTRWDDETPGAQENSSNCRNLALTYLSLMKIEAEALILSLVFDCADRAVSGYL
jgi:hypothetical protein